MSRIKILYTCIAFFFLPIHSKQTVRVLFVMDTFLCDTKTVIINQALGLHRRGFCVSILAKEKGDSQNFLELDFVDKLYIGTISQIDLHDFDVIVCQYGSLGKECAPYLQKNKKTKLITFFRGADITATNETCSGSYNVLFSVGDLFLPVCSYYAYLLEILGCDPKKICVQPSGINCSLFKFRFSVPTLKQLDPKSKNQEPVHIITVSRLVEKKGLEDALQAISILIHEGYNIEYTIVGEGNKKNSLLNLIKKLKINDKVHIIGQQTNRQVARLLSKAHIFLLPSVTCSNGSQEGIPNVLKEAMSTGLPVISTYHAGIRELIKHKESGLLAPERDILSLAKNIKYLIHNPDKWEPLVSTARKVVETLYNTKYLNDILAQRIRELVTLH